MSKCSVLLGLAVAVTPALLGQGILTSGQPTNYTSTVSATCSGSGVLPPQCYVVAGLYNIAVPQGANRLDVSVTVNAGYQGVMVFILYGSDIPQDSSGYPLGASYLGAANANQPLQASILSGMPTGLSLQPGTWTIGLYMDFSASAFAQTLSTRGTILATASAGPVVNGISPTSAAANGPAFTLTVNGSGFVSGSTVAWNGSSLATSYMSGAQLTASVPASSIATEGSANVTVQNPGGGEASNAVAFTVAPPGWPVGTKILPQFVFGGGFYSALYFANTTASAVSFTVSFVTENASAMNVPSVGGASAVVSIPPYGTTIIEAPNTGAVTEGWATFSPPTGVTGYGVLRQSISGRADQEAVVPFSDATVTSSTLIWDDTAFTTSVAIVNPSPVNTTVAVTVHDDQGRTIGTAYIPLSAGNHTATILRNVVIFSNSAYSMTGHRGYATFTVNSGNVAVLGLRFGDVAFTSIPTSDK
jgi:hypothetical protein